MKSPTRQRIQLRPVAPRPASAYGFDVGQKIMIPDYWKEFIEDNDLIHAEVEIPESRDLSKVGADFQIMSAEDSDDESENFYPGLVVRKDGYVPVGSCLLGSGDPYFINEKEGRNGGLYRIYHDTVLDENYDKEKAIALVLKNYEDIIK